MAEIRIAVIGVGRVGLTHAENLAHRVRGAQMVAVTTSRAERAAEARRRCGNVPVYPTLETLLAIERLDGVIIASSTSAHADNVEQYAAAGWHIFCEKPLALTLGGGRRSFVRRLSVGYNWGGPPPTAAPMRAPARGMRR